MMTRATARIRLRRTELHGQSRRARLGFRQHRGLSPAVLRRAAGRARRGHTRHRVRRSERAGERSTQPRRARRHARTARRARSAVRRARYRSPDRRALRGETASRRACAAEPLPRRTVRRRPEWTDGRIKGSTHTGAYVAIVIGVIWNLIAWPTAWPIGPEVANGNSSAAFVFVFPLVGIGLAAWAIRAWLQLKRFKVATLVLERLPVALGGRLKASVRVDAEVPIATDFRLELECVEERITATSSTTTSRSKPPTADTPRPARLPTTTSRLGSRASGCRAKRAPNPRESGSASGNA
jgi:hypothetical protein